MSKKIVLCLLLFVATAAAQNPANYAVYDGKGRASSLDALIASIADVDVVFLGEDHDDVIGHQLQMEIFRRVVENYSAKRKVTLSLEMFERDVQVILNEYLKDQISETHFLRSSRPWDNYKRDYRPLLELAKSKRLEVIAANAPRRYVNMVSRNGIASLAGLTPEAKRWLPPFPIAKPSQVYSEKFKRLMGNTGDASLGLDKILISQSLWDAAMAHAVSQSLKKNPRSLVVHLNGHVHTENRLGTVEHLLSYRPKTKAIVVTVLPVDDIKKFEHTDAGDFVILTRKNPTLPVSAIRTTINRMEKAYSSSHSMSGDVTQIDHNVQLQASEETKGSFLYTSRMDEVVPGGGNSRTVNLRVDWPAPRSETLTVTDDRYSLFIPRTNIVYEGSLNDKKLEGMYDFLSLPISTTRKNVKNIVLLSDSAKLKSGERTLHLKLELTVASKLFKYVELWVGADGFVRQFKFTGLNGDTVMFQLSNIKLDPKINGSSYEVKLPKNVKRIRA